MVTLTQPGTANPSIPRQQDDRSDYRHRQAIGYIGLVLPAILVLVAGFFPEKVLPRWRPLDSISAYSYTAASAAFVGLLVALALFLFTYQGYANEHRWADRAAAVLAGAAALGVAFFPTGAPDPALVLPWSRPWMPVAHYLCAVVLFAMFAIFALWLFRKTGDQPPSPDKLRRNRIYLACGLAILAGMAWALAAGTSDQPIFLPECLVLLGFSLAWLTKGYALRSVRETIRSGVSRARRTVT